MTYILQKYILKELLRGFLMTAVALTCLMGFGGGVMDMLRSQGITAQEMIKLMIYLMPVVLAYSLPVAALFSTTITYGRLSADNEINACRASGVNIYRILLPAVILSIIVSATTFTLQNYTIPNLAARIELLIKRDIRTLAYMELKNRKYINKMNYALHCEKVISANPPEVLPDGTETPGQIELSQVAFLRYDHDIPIFFGTAKTALILFENIKDTSCVTIHMNQVRAFNVEREQVTQVDYFPIGPVPIPAMTSTKLKFLSLPILLTILKDPFKFQRLEDQKKSLYAVLRNSLTYEHLVEQYRKQYKCELKDARGQYSITANSCRQIPKDGKIILEGDVTLHSNPVGGSPATFSAKDATISVSAISEDLPPKINIELKGVKVTETHSGNSKRFATHERYTVGPINVPPEVLESASPKNANIDTILSSNSPYNFNDDLNKKRAYLSFGKAETIRKGIAEIHTRLAYSFSALVLLILGASLGIIFKGGHFVSAFGLSFIPLMIVVVLIMTGKQLTAAGSLNMGMGVIWLGLAIVALANLVILGKFLRR
ncbi:MAG: LptF/LptG family permease [Phycisphaerae bacterium]